MPGFEIFGDEERREVRDVLDTGVLFRYGFDGARKGHWKARSFESELAQRMEIDHCHLCASGTGALCIALAAAGVGAGDEIIVPPFTFIATIEAVLATGAVPVFAEIDETLCLDPGAVEAAITPRTRAVMPVHMCGAMARIEEIQDLCQRRGLLLIEDACQAFGGSMNGKALGTFGHLGCFSFDAVKTITCGEGGAVVTADRELYDRTHAFGDHGHDHLGNDRGLEGHAILGVNFRISELNAAVGLAQLRKLDRILETQRQHLQPLRRALAKFDEVSFRSIPDESGDTATFLTFFLPTEARARHIAGELAQAGVDGCFYWYDNLWHYLRQWHHLKNLKTAARLPQTLLTHFDGYDQVRLPRSDDIMGRAISMQIKLSWSEQELEDRVQKIQTVFGG